MSQQTYIAKNILPAFSGMVNQDMMMTIYDLEGNIILTTNKLAQSFGYANWQELVGVNFANIAYSKPIKDDESQEVKQNLSAMLDLRDQISKVRQIVINEKKPLTSLLIHPFTHVFKNFLLLTLTPLFDDNQEIIALMGITTTSSMFGMLEFKTFLEQINLPSTKLIKIPQQLPVILTKRQHEVLFLLLIGATQETVAQILNVTRGSIAKTISQSLLPKFNLHGAAVRTLVDKCRKQNLQYLIPASLCTPKLILLDRDIALRYHLT